MIRLALARSHRPFCIAFALLAAPLAAQVDARAGAYADSSAAAVLRARGSVSLARDVLRQPSAPQLRAKLDELADSLANRMIAAPADGDTSEPARVARARAHDALDALAMAGAARGLEGIAYDGALERFLRVHRTAGSPRSMRWRVLRTLLSVPGHDAALAYLAEVAESGAPDAYAAVLALKQEGVWPFGKPTPEERAATEKVLQELVRRDRVCETMARSLLACVPACGVTLPPNTVLVCM